MGGDNLLRVSWTCAEVGGGLRKERKEVGNLGKQLIRTKRHPGIGAEKMEFSAAAVCSGLCLGDVVILKVGRTQGMASRDRKSVV